MARFSVAVAVVWLWALMANGETALVQAWQQRYDGPSRSNDYAVAIALDDRGNMFVFGYSHHGSEAREDYITIKYSEAGVPLWTNRYNGPANTRDFAEAAAVDLAGNIIVTGFSWPGPALDEDFGYVTVKYSGNGIPLWTNRYDGLPQKADIARAIAVDREGSVLVTGASAGNSGRSDYATIKYSGDGLPLWTNRYDFEGGNDEASAIITDHEGNVFVAGFSPGGATIKYSSEGTPLWTNRHNGSVATAIGIDGSGNLFVTGRSPGDYVTIKYSIAGLALWTNYFNGLGDAMDAPTVLTVDNAGHVVVAGISWSGTSYDYATLKYLNDGKPLWTNRFDGGERISDDVTALSVDKDGNSFVTGRSHLIDFPSDIVTIKYSAMGVPLWTNRYDGGGTDDGATASAVGTTGSLFMAGYSSQGANPNYITIKYVEVSPINLQSPSLTSGVFQCSFTNTPGAPFTLLTTPNLSAPSNSWTVIDCITETSPGHFNFIDRHLTNGPARLYRVRSP